MPTQLSLSASNCNEVIFGSIWSVCLFLLLDSTGNYRVSKAKIKMVELSFTNWHNKSNHNFCNVLDLTLSVCSFLILPHGPFLIFIRFDFIFPLFCRFFLHFVLSPFFCVGPSTDQDLTYDKDRGLLRYSFIKEAPKRTWKMEQASKASTE